MRYATFNRITAIDDRFIQLSLGWADELNFRMSRIEASILARLFTPS